MTDKEESGLDRLKNKIRRIKEMTDILYPDNLILEELLNETIKSK